MTGHLVGSPAFFSFDADRCASWPGQALDYRIGVAFDRGAGLSSARATRGARP